MKYGHIKTRLDERFKLLNEGMYEYYIPKKCTLRTYKDHSRIMLCWGLLCDLQKGITHSRCDWSCEFSQDYDKKRLWKMMKKI